MNTDFASKNTDFYEKYEDNLKYDKMLPKGKQHTSKYFSIGTYLKAEIKEMLRIEQLINLIAEKEFSKRSDLYYNDTRGIDGYRVNDIIAERFDSLNYNT